MEKIVQNGVPIGEKFFGGEHFLTKPEGIRELVSLVISNALVVAGVIFLFILVFGGISMIAGAGRSDPEQAAKGRQAATTAAIGFIIVFAAYWIIQIIQTITKVPILGPI